MNYTAYIYFPKWVQYIRRWTGTDRQRDYRTSLRNINCVGNEAKDDPSKDFWTVSGTGAGHVAQRTASYMVTTIHCPVKDGRSVPFRSHSQSASFEDVKQMLIRLIRIELRFRNRQPLILVTIPTELPRMPKQSNTTIILATVTVCSVVTFITIWARCLLSHKGNSPFKTVQITQNAVSTGTLFLRKLQRVHKLPSGVQVSAVMN